MREPYEDWRDVDTDTTTDQAFTWEHVNELNETIAKLESNLDRLDKLVEHNKKIVGDMWEVLNSNTPHKQKNEQLEYLLGGLYG